MTNVTGKTKETVPLSAGTKVRINVQVIADKGWLGLQPSQNKKGKDYMAYIVMCARTRFHISRVIDVDGELRFILDDPFLSDMSFPEDELIKHKDLPYEKKAKKKTESN